MADCPSCFNALEPQTAAWICASSKCRPKTDATASDFAGYAIDQKTITHSSASPKVNERGEVLCSSCNEPVSDRVCPVCHYGPLPLDWFDSNTTCIAMAGARYTGKSFYIAIAVRQLMQLGSRSGVAVDFADNRTRTNFARNYEKPLFEERRIIPPTPAHDTGNPPQRFPLIFSLGVVGGRRQYLVFRDVAGEDIERENINSKHLQFMAAADAVFFLFDPLRVTSVTDLLPGLVHQQTTGGDPFVVLTNVLRLIGNRRPRLAVILSKFDTLEELRKVDKTRWSQVMSNTGAAMLRDPSISSSTYDEEDGRLLHQEVRSLLLGLNAVPFVTSIERPTNGNHLDHRFFAVSVLGESATESGLGSRGIAPLRCIDPLRWVMSQTITT